MGIKIWNTDISNIILWPSVQPTPRLPVEYQEVEYIESWNWWNTQNIQFYLPYFDSDWHYSLEIDVWNIWNAEWTLFTILQTIVPSS